MLRFLLSLCVVLGIAAFASAQESKPLRAGIIGLDTSHVVAFTRILNNPKATGDLAGVRDAVLRSPHGR